MSVLCAALRNQIRPQPASQKKKKKKKKKKKESWRSMMNIVEYRVLYKTSHPPYSTGCMIASQVL